MKKYEKLFDDTFNIFEKEYGTFDKRMLENDVRDAIRLAKTSIDFRLKTLTKRQLKGKSKSEIGYELARDILLDKAIYKSESYLDKWELDMENKVNSFDIFQYTERTKNFMLKYGTEKQKYGKSTRTLEEWFERYKSGRIKKSTMNKIITKFKKEINYVKPKEGSL